MNPKMTTPVPSSSQMSSVPDLYSVQAARMNTALPAALRDPTPPAVARKRGRNHNSSLLPRSSSRIGMHDSSSSLSYADRPHKASRKKDRHGQPLTDTRPSLVVRLPMAGSTKSLPVPPSDPSQNEVLFSSSRDMIAPNAAPKNTYHRAGHLLSSGGSIAPSAASSAILYALRVNTSGQAVLLRSRSRIAPTTMPRVRIICDAREALKHLIRARSSARISSSQADTPSHQASMYDQQPVQSASHQASLYEQQPVQSASVRRPAPYRHHSLPQQQAPRHQEGFHQRRRLPEGLSHGYQQRSYQRHEYPQRQPFDQPAAFQQQRHANPKSKRWHQSLWNDGMM